MRQRIDTTTRRARQLAVRMRARLRKHGGQAIVEFALCATLIFFLLAAAVDLGLVFFSMQGLNNAGQEGAAWGAVNVQSTVSGSGSSTTYGSTLRYDEIRDRVRKESGTKGGIGFVNLLDLNSNGQCDVYPTGQPANCSTEVTVGSPGVSYETLANGTRVIDDYIKVSAVQDVDSSGIVNASSPICADPQRASSTQPCYVLVQVSSDYKPIFPIAPVIGGRTLRLTSNYSVLIHDLSTRGDTSATVTTDQYCELPSFIGMKKSAAQAAFANSGFTGGLTVKSGSGDYTVKYQDPNPSQYSTSPAYERCARKITIGP